MCFFSPSSSCLLALSDRSVIFCSLSLWPCVWNQGFLMRVDSFTQKHHLTRRCSAVFPHPDACVTFWNGFFVFEPGGRRNSWHSRMVADSTVLVLPPQCVSLLFCHHTTMRTTQDVFSSGFYRKQMVGYYVDDTVSHRWLFQAAHSASLLFSSPTETPNIKHYVPFLAC